MSREILLLEPSGKGGLIHYSYCLAQALVERGEEVCLVTPARHDIGRLPRTFHLEGAFGRALDLRRLLTLYRVIRRNGEDAVHLQGSVHPEFYLPLLWFVRRLKVGRVVYTAHEVLPFKNPYLRVRAFDVLFRSLRVLQRLYALVDAIIVHSHRDRETLVQGLRVPDAKIFVIPHGNYTFFSRLDGTTPPEPAPDRRPPTVLFFGVIIASKGLDCLIRAFDLVRRVVPDARLVIVGQPYEDVRPYEALIRELALGALVELVLGYAALEEIPRHFRAADVVAIPYLKASQSGVIHVASAFSKPVVASACGGIPELVVDGKTGILVPSGNIEELAKGLITLLTDEAMRRRMGAEARRRAEFEYPWGKVAEATVRVYDARV